MRRHRVRSSRGPRLDLMELPVLRVRVFLSHNILVYLISQNVTPSSQAPARAKLISPELKRFHEQVHDIVVLVGAG